MRKKKDKIDKEAEKLGLKDPPVEIIFQTAGTVREVHATCGWCKKERSTRVTVFAEDFTYEQLQEDLIFSHHVFECQAWRWRIERWCRQLDGWVLAKFRRKSTPWGIKHKDWKMTVKR